MGASARELPEDTGDCVDVSAAVTGMGITGMGTATALGRHFNRTVGVPPGTRRRTFRSRPVGLSANSPGIVRDR